MSGRLILVNAARRGLPVATIDPLGSSSIVDPSSEITASRGSSRSGTAATVSPSGSAVGRSFMLWTATSISPSISARWSSLTKTDVPIDPTGRLG